MSQFRNKAEENINKALLSLKVARPSATGVWEREIAAGHSRVAAKISRFNGILISDIEKHTKLLATTYGLSKENCIQINSMKREEVMNCIVEWFELDHPENGYLLIVCGKDRERQTFSTAIASWKESVPNSKFDSPEDAQKCGYQSKPAQDEQTYHRYLHIVWGIVCSFVFYLSTWLPSNVWFGNALNGPELSSVTVKNKPALDSSVQTHFKNYFRYRALMAFMSERLLDYIPCVDDVSEIN